MNFINLFFGVLLVAISGFVNADQTDKERELSEVLTFAAKVVNDKAPMTLDADTRLDSAATYSNLFIYNNTVVNYTAEQLDLKQFDKIISDNVIATICANVGLKAMKDLEVVMIYRYLGKDGKFITEHSLDTKSCKKT